MGLQRWTRGRGRAKAAGLLAGCGLLTAVAAPGPAIADPGRYDVWSCRGPLGDPVGTSAWTLGATGAASGDVVLRDDCATGGPLMLSLAPGRAFEPGVRGSLTFTAPSGSHIDSWTVWRSLETAGPDPDSGLYDYAAALTERKGQADSDQGCATTQPSLYPCLAVGDSASWDAAGNRVDRTGTPVLDALALWVGCRGAVCDAPLLSAPATARLWGARVQVHDLSPPAVPELSGTLVGEEPVTGLATVVVESSDEGGGVAATTLAVDDGLPRTSAPAGPRGTCQEPYTVVQPCPSATARAFTVDTSTLADGPHTLSGTVADAAGNVTRWGPVTFTVAHPPVIPPVIPPVTPPVDPPVTPQPPAGNGVPAVKAPRVRLGSAAYVRAGGRVRLTGTVTTASGEPIAGAHLTVSARELATVSERVRSLPDAVTDSAGRFSVSVRGVGAERVTVGFAPSDGAAETARAVTTVRERASLTATRSKARLKRGQTVVVRGRLRGAGGAARGAIVELQAIVGGSWRTVGTVRADARGRYAWRYRFVHVTRDTIFSFRALIRSTPGWPWPELRSGRVQVRVDGAAEP
jgi:hypothetical protein